MASHFTFPSQLIQSPTFAVLQKTGGSWSRYSNFEEALKSLVLIARPSEWVLEDKAVKVAGRPVVVSAIGAYTTLDASNLSKSVCDALQNVLYPNDTDIASEASQVYKRQGKNKSGWVAFAQLPPGASALEVAAAQAALITELAGLALS